ncbi:MAG TPA: CpsD/CapB family tyrosine-protein kinase [Candidatus Tectomicrobia bacterium]
MLPFRRRTNTVEKHVGLQKVAEDWLLLTRGAHTDAVAMPSQQDRGKVKLEDNPRSDAENVTSSVAAPSLPGSGDADISGVDPHLVPLLTPDAFEAEPYRVLAHLIGQMHTEAGLHVLALSSPGSGDGKTSTAINLAGTLAHKSKIRVLLVEAEFRRPSIAKYLGIRHTNAGIIAMLLEPTLSLERAVQHCQPFNFDVLLAEHASASPYDLLKLPRFGSLLHEARKHYDYVIVDMPPLLPFADCRLIEKWIDGLLLVVAAHETPRKLLAEALEIADPTKLVGLVLNKDDQQTARYDHAYRYYAQSPNEHGKG